MLAVITPLITRGVIDNTTRGVTHLTLWGVDEGEPIDFILPGNCLRDIAGCRVCFTNRSCTQAQTEEHPVLARMRSHAKGPVQAGDITLSRRVPEQDNRRALCNQLSIELFVERDTRILIETTEFDYDISLPQWSMSWAEANTQAFLNMEALRDHVAYNVARFKGPALQLIQEEKLPSCSWDMRLNRAEAYMAIHPTIRSKYCFEIGGQMSEAYVMDRTDLLNQMAAEDEAHMPPENDTSREWDVLDFVLPEHAKVVREAMHHPLFQETSRLTMLVQKHVMVRENVGKAEAEEFVKRYAGVVSYILATILLTRQSSFPVDLASRRVQIIHRHVQELCARCIKADAEIAAVFREAAGLLLSKLDEFAATFQH